MDWHKLQHTLFEMDPSDPREDLAKLQAQAGKPQESVAPTKDYLQESVEVEEGSMPLGIDSIADFAALAGVKTTVTEKDNPFAPDAFEKGVKNAWKGFTGSDGSSDGKPTTGKKSAPRVKGMHPQLLSKLTPHATALEKIFTDKTLKNEFLNLMKKATPTAEADERKIKPRDPNWRDMEALRKSGAAGSHKDKKKLAKQGYSKHKGKQYESIKDELWARLNAISKS